MQFISGEVWLKGGRRENEDSIAVQEIVTRRGSLFLAVVCDGMGGHEEGETASGAVAEHILQWLYDDVLACMKKGMGSRYWKRLGSRCFYKANRKLNDYAARKGIFLGTTMTLLILYRGRYQLFHIGDSRAYRIRSGVCAAVGQCRRKGHLFSGYAVRQLTKDDVVQGQLTRCMGAEQNEMPVYKTGRLHRKEGFLLCSDGFYGRLKDAEMAEALMPRWMSEESSIRRTLRELAKCAQTRGERDNISAVYVVIR